MIQSIKSKVIAASIAMMVVTGVSSGVGLWSTLTLDVALKESEKASQAVRDASRADMMHDAIHSDVLTALLSSEDAIEARAELANHISTLQSSITSARDITRDPKSLEDFRALEPTLAFYATSAERIVSLAASDPAAADRGLAEFKNAFEGLEVGLEAVGGDLEAVMTAAVLRANAQASIAKIILSVTVGLGLILGGIIILAGLRLIVRPIRDLTDTLTAMSIGKDDVTLSGATRKDELGDISRAVVALQALIISRMNEASKGAADSAAVIEASKRSLGSSSSTLRATSSTPTRTS